MQTRFKKNAKVADIMITFIGGTLSVSIMLYGIYHFGLSNAWPELITYGLVACFISESKDESGIG